MTGTRSDERGSASPRRVPLLVIRPGATPIGQYMRDLNAHRDLISVLATRDLKLRYRQTILGASWVVIQPILAGGVLGFIFGSVAKLPTGGVNPFVFAYAGMLGFSAFSNGLSRTTGSLVANSALVAKIFFPRMVIPLSIVWGVVVDFTVSLGVLIVMELLSDSFPGWPILLVPVWLVAFLLMGHGIGAFLASLAVRYRDVPQITPVLLQMLMYLSPVAYSVSAIPEQYRTAYYINPLAPLIEAFHWSTVGTPFPPTVPLVYAFAVAVLSFLGGMFALERMEKGFADVI